MDKIKKWFDNRRQSDRHPSPLSRSFVLDRASSQSPEPPDPPIDLSSRETRTQTSIVINLDDEEEVASAVLPGLRRLLEACSQSERILKDKCARLEQEKKDMRADIESIKLRMQREIDREKQRTMRALQHGRGGDHCYVKRLEQEKKDMSLAHVENFSCYARTIDECAKLQKEIQALSQSETQRAALSQSERILKDKCARLEEEKKNKCAKLEKENQTLSQSEKVLRGQLETEKRRASCCSVTDHKNLQALIPMVRRMQEIVNDDLKQDPTKSIYTFTEGRHQYCSSFIQQCKLFCATWSQRWTPNLLAPRKTGVGYAWLALHLYILMI